MHMSYRTIQCEHWLEIDVARNIRRIPPNEDVSMPNWKLRVIALFAALSATGTLAAQERPGIEPDRAAMYQHLKAAREIAGADLYAHYVHRCIVDQTYRRTISRGVQAHGTIPATRVFDDLYFVGENAVSAWVLDSGDGLILFDALNSAEDIQNIVEPGLRSLGLDPARLRYLVITHAHGDHFGGARYLREKYGVRIMASATDWREMQRLASGAAQTPANWAALVPEHDLDITDRQVFKLGRATLTFYITPGHTPGTVSTVFEATDGRIRHTVGFFGGLGTPESREAKLQLIDSLESFKEVVRQRNLDVLIANHPTQDQSIPKLEELRLRRSGDPNPYVLGKNRYLRYLSIQQECTRFAMAQQGQTSPSAKTSLDVYFGDGGTSAFYRWDAPLDKPGKMLRQEPVGEGFYDANASRAVRILYSSTDGRFDRAVVEASGLLYLPKGTPPAGGWPLVVWGHGTFGIADVCAPSWKRPTPRDGSYTDVWLQRGFAVVAPDYQGLGTRGVHPYTQSKPEGYSVLDAARAALAAYPDQIANRIILTGQSQGSGAVLSATVLAPDYAPELRLLGTIATALVQRADDHVDTVGDVLGDDSVRYLVMRLLGGGFRPGSPAPDELLTSKGALMREAARTSCSRDLIPVAREHGITANNAFTVKADRLARLPQSLAIEKVKLSVPLFVGTGLADSVIPPSGQYDSVVALCGLGDHVQWKTYDGVNHSATSNRAIEDAVGFARAVLAGQAPPSNCGNLVKPGALQAPDRSIPFSD
jgi:glyoxylase-like metal-dependent hydrolase (beta-lactamase superfamily II)/dienelactone hydrolase